LRWQTVFALPCLIKELSLPAFTQIATRLSLDLSISKPVLPMSEKKTVPFRKNRVIAGVAAGLGGERTHCHQYFQSCFVVLSLMLWPRRYPLSAFWVLVRVTIASSYPEHTSHRLQC
jgi:hypothetical protein